MSEIPSGLLLVISAVFDLFFGFCWRVYSYKSGNELRECCEKCKGRSKTSHCVVL